MKPFDIRSVLALAALALLGACGGTAPDAADSQAAPAALALNANLPQADCEAEGCNRPRIIDDLAEQFRAGAIEQQALAAAPDPANALPAAPADPVVPQGAAAD